MFVEPMAPLVVNAIQVSYIRTLAPDETDPIVSDTSAPPAPRSLQRGHRTVAEWRYQCRPPCCARMVSSLDDMPDEDEIKPLPARSPLVRPRPSKWRLLWRLSGSR